MVSTRRKSVSFADPPPEGSRLRKPSAPFESSVPGSENPTPSSAVEQDGGFKFKRRRGKSDAQTTPTASGAPGAPAAPDSESASKKQKPAAAPSPGRRSSRRSLKPGATALPAVSEHPAVAESAAEPPASKRGNRRLSVAPAPPVAPPTPEAEAPDAPAPQPTLDAVPRALLEAFYEVCERGEQKALSTAADASWCEGQSVRDVCLQELHRLGVCHAGGISTNAALRAREHVLLGRLRELTAAEREWSALAEATPEEVEEEALPIVEIDQDQEPQLAALPPIPNVEAQLEGLKMMASLCSDQVELALKAMSRICAQSDAVQKSLAQTAHSEAFKGYLDVQQPKNLIRSLAAA